MFVIISYRVDYMIVVSENNFVFVFFIIYPLFFCTKENVYSYDDLQFSICHSECHNFQIDKVSSIEHILMTVNYSYNTCQNQLSFLYTGKEKKIHMPIKSIPKHSLIREISIWIIIIIIHDPWIDPLKKITSMNPWPCAIQTSPPFTDNSHLWNSTPLVFTY